MKNKPKISTEECGRIAKRFVDTGVTLSELNEELNEKYKVKTARWFIKKAVANGDISKEQYSDACKRKQAPKVVKHSEETKLKIARKHAKLKGNDLANFCYDYSFFGNGTSELSNNYDINQGNFPKLLKLGVKEGYITESERKSAVDRRIGFDTARDSLSKDDLGTIIEFLEEEVELYKNGEIDTLTTNKEIAVQYGLSAVGLNARLRKANPSFKDYRNKELSITAQVKSGKKAFFNGTGVHSLSAEERSRIGSENLIKTLKTQSRKSYNVENRFATQSIEEGAVALTLEKYIKNYVVQDSKNFQVRNKGINNGGIDFLVNNEFLEWHPIILMSGRGDIDSKEEFNSYQKAIEGMSKEDRKSFEREYKQVLGANYKSKRQDSIDNSDYSGAQVSLATIPNELYNFISKHSDALPEFNEFNREFNKTKKYVKTFKTKIKSKEQAA